MPEGLRLGGLRVAKHSGQETGDSFYCRGRGHFATGQHKISQGDLLVDEVLCDAFVDPLVSTADECDVRLPRPFIEGWLIERGTARGEQDLVARSHGFESIGERADHQNHSGTASKGSIVNLAVNAPAEFAQIDQGHLEQTGLPGPPDHADLQRPLEKLWKKRDDRYLHDG